MAEHQRVASSVAQAPAVEHPAASRGVAPSNETRDVALDLLREHNALCAALVAGDLAGMMSRLSTVAQLVIQSGMERSMAAGKISLGITVLLDLVATGVAIAGIYAAAADWEAFKKEDARLRELWGQCAFLFGGFVRLAERTRSVTTVLAADIGGHEQAIADLDELYGEGLYAL